MGTEKRDFENLDVRMYLALKSVVDAGCPAPVFEQVNSVMCDFEDSFGPIPDWAIRRNFAYELIPGTQLCTRDGRVTGNAHILRVIPLPMGRDDKTVVYACITDAGSYIKSMTEQELLNQFWVGDWISDPKTLIARFGNHGEDYGLPEMP